MTNPIDQALAALEPFAEYAAMYDECEQHPDGCPDSMNYVMRQSGPARIPPLGKATS